MFARHDMEDLQRMFLPFYQLAVPLKRVQRYSNCRNMQNISCFVNFILDQSFNVVLFIDYAFTTNSQLSTSLIEMIKQHICAHTRTHTELEISQIKLMSVLFSVH